MKENKSLNPFDFSKKTIRLTDNDMNKVIGGAQTGSGDACDTCVQGPSCDPDTCTASPSCDPKVVGVGGFAAVR